jgi:hypothetical protein
MKTLQFHAQPARRLRLGLGEAAQKIKCTRTTAEAFFLIDLHPVPAIL